VIYRVSAINEAGLIYDEELITAEDVDMNIRILNKGYRLMYRSDLIAWHNKRDRPLQFFHQIRRFAIGRVQVGRSHKEAVRPLHTFMGFFAPLVLIIGVSAVTAGYISYAIVVLLAAIATLFLAGFVSSGSLRVALLCLPVSVIFVLGWSVGYISSILFINKIQKQI
jgi:cellulose synthase/poly-beta-1,6-N-acetylglucosamine synthase-like glycosyltransferase